MIKLNKSYYKIKNNFFYNKIFTCILLCVCILIMYLNKRSFLYNLGYAFMNTCCFVYYISRVIFVEKEIKKNNLILTEYSKKIFRIHKIIIKCYFVMVCACNLIYLYYTYIGYYDVKVWIWYGILLPILYSDNVHLSAITAFGYKKYISGEYLLNYSDINKIDEIKTLESSKGRIVLIRLWKNNKELGYDKLFVDEYHKLRLCVYQNRRKV